jgi:hypothetical protein
MVNLETFEPVADSDEVLCFACRFNEIIPNFSILEHIPLWKKMAVAKRCAIFTLKALSLPLRNIKQDPEAGLSFYFTTDRDVSDHLVRTKLSFIHHAIHDSLDHMPEMIEEADNA